MADSMRQRLEGVEEQTLAPYALRSSAATRRHPIEDEGRARRIIEQEARILGFDLGRDVEQIGRMQRTATWMKRSVPTLLGEFGIPFDLHQGEAYEAWARGDRSDKPWQPHVKALDLKKLAALKAPE